MKKSLLALTVLALCWVSFAADSDTANLNRKQAAAESAEISAQSLPVTAVRNRNLFVHFYVRRK